MVRFDHWVSSRKGEAVVRLASPQENKATASYVIYRKQKTPKIHSSVEYQEQLPSGFFLYRYFLESPTFPSKNSEKNF